MTDESEISESDDVPPWWDENVEIRDELDLPEYDAPKFEDGSYVHSIVEELESRFDCQIQFIDPSPSKVSQWEIRVDGHPVETVPRKRDRADANTIFVMTTEEFEATIEDAAITTED